MPLKTKVSPVSRDFNLLLDDIKDPFQRAIIVANFARDDINEARQINRQALGYDPVYTVFVDGRENAPLESVRNVIVAEFKLVDNVIMWIHNQLETHSPVKSGRYKRSHALFADNKQIEAVPPIPIADEYVFVNLVPYARKIERGESAHAPNGVYEAVAHLAQQQFRDIARITFSYRTALTGVIIGGRFGNRSENRNPAIIIRGKV